MSKEPKSVGEATEGPQKAPASPVAKRPPGAKELPPLAWKLVGTSAGMPVTLLRCVDRADAEAQMERLASERYYQDLAIHPFDKKVQVSASMAKTRRDAIALAIREADERAKIKAARKSSSDRKGQPTVKSRSVKMKTKKHAKANARAKTKTVQKAGVVAGKTRKSKAKSTAKTAKKSAAKSKPKSKSKAAKKGTRARSGKSATKKAKTKRTKRRAK